MNPYYEWAMENKLYQNNDIAVSLIPSWKVLNAQLANKINTLYGIKINEDIGPNDKWFELQSIIWSRVNISSCIISNAIFEKIIKISNGHIWDIGCGTGYNSSVFQKMGAFVYPMDLKNSSSYFTDKITFTGVYEYDTADGLYEEDLLKQIVDSDGVALYIWPWREYYHLSKWIKSGGKKVITIGAFNAPDGGYMLDHPEIPEIQVPRVCPPFKNKGWKLIEQLSIDSLSLTDASGMSTFEYWELID